MSIPEIVVNNGRDIDFYTENSCLESSWFTIIKIEKMIQNSIDFCNSDMDPEDLEVARINASWERSGEFAVIKTVTVEKNSSVYAAQCEELKKEGTVLRYLSEHVNHKVVKLINPGMCNEKPSLFLEFIDGENLHTFSNKSNLHINKIKDIARQLFSAIQFIHNLGVVHGDITPKNIVVARKGDGFQLRLIDFAFSYMSGVEPPITGGGTWSYCPPEWLVKSKEEPNWMTTREIRHWSFDIWSAVNTLINTYCVTVIFGAHSAEEIMKKHQSILGLEYPEEFALSPVVHGPKLLAQEDSELCRKLHQAGENMRDTKDAVNQFFHLAAQGLQFEPLNRPSANDILRSDFLHSTQIENI